MDDSELERLIEQETMDRLAVVTGAAQQQLLRLAQSLMEAADAFDALAAATDPTSPDLRRDAFRRQECPGRF